MAIKFSELTPLSVVDGTLIVPIVDTTGINTSKKTTVDDIKTFILAGNAATATKFADPVNINGIPFDGSSDINIETSIPIATSTVLGGVIIGSGIDVQLNGTISVSIPSKLFHGFYVNQDGDLIYTTVDNGNIFMQDTGGNDIYQTADMGTDDYSYSIDASGNLVVTYA